MNPKHNSKVRLLLCVVFALCYGCAGPAIQSRLVQQDDSWFVRLDSYADVSSSSPPYGHPAALTIDELSAILSRLLLEERVGIMDRPRPPRPVFSLEEVSVLAPTIQDSFAKATPREWISFALSTPIENQTVITSGGMFLSDSLLHVVIANHRTPVDTTSEDLSNVRANPLGSIRGSGSILTFESSRFVMGTQANWAGGHRASASELILDYKGFLSFLRYPGAAATLSPPMTPAPQASETDPHNPLLQLQEEVRRLQKKVQEQEEEIRRLKQASPLH
ncbi:hypothetical protein [Petrachloros mirabilis]